MEKLTQNQLFSYISSLGSEKRTGEPLLATDGTPLQEMIPHHSWYDLDNKFFESKTVEELKAFNTGLVFFKASYPNAKETVNTIYGLSLQAIHQKSSIEVRRSESTQTSLSLIREQQPPAEDKKAQRTKRVQKHIEKQLGIAKTYPSYVGKAFIPEIEEGTNRLIGPEEYLQKPAKLVSGETFELVMNSHLLPVEAAERVNQAHMRAQEEGKVIKSDCAAALIRSATAFEGELFDMLANVLMS